MSDAIREHWDQQASLYGQDEQATMPDTYLRQLEIQAIKKYLTATDRVLDVGCGNGFGTLSLVRAVNSGGVGVDFSTKMIEQANDKLTRCEQSLRRRVRFQVENVLRLPSELGLFDKVTSARCLINLRGPQEQLLALRQIHERLQRGGQAVLSEDTIEGLGKINALRGVVGLPDLAVRWHNHYVDVPFLVRHLTGLFKLVGIDEFSSTYYMMSRVVNARLAADKGEEPRYDADINRVAAQLPAVGDYGLLKIIVLERL